MHKTGTIFVIAAPSGTGKTSLVKMLVESLDKITISISHTTREKRPEEQVGVNYFFIDKNQFNISYYLGYARQFPGPRIFQ